MAQRSLASNAHSKGHSSLSIPRQTCGRSRRGVAVLLVVSAFATAAPAQQSAPPTLPAQTQAPANAPAASNAPPRPVAAVASSAAAPDAWMNTSLSADQRADLL